MQKYYFKENWSPFQGKSIILDEIFDKISILNGYRVYNRLGQTFSKHFPSNSFDFILRIKNNTLGQKTLPIFK